MFASKEEIPAMPTTDPEVPTPIDPNAHLQQFLTENDYELSVGALSERTPFLDKRGFVMSDKPLLVVSARKKV